MQVDGRGGIHRFRDVPGNSLCSRSEVARLIDAAVKDHRFSVHFHRGDGNRTTGNHLQINLRTFRLVDKNIVLPRSQLLSGYLQPVRVLDYDGILAGVLRDDSHFHRYYTVNPPLFLAVGKLISGNGIKSAKNVILSDVFPLTADVFIIIRDRAGQLCLVAENPVLVLSFRPALFLQFPGGSGQDVCSNIQNLGLCAVPIVAGILDHRVYSLTVDGFNGYLRRSAVFAVRRLVILQRYLGAVRYHQLVNLVLQRDFRNSIIGVGDENRIFLVAISAPLRDLYDHLHVGLRDVSLFGYYGQQTVSICSFGGIF